MPLSLFEISTMAKTDLKAAEKELLPLVVQLFKQLKITKLRINPSKLSLNSVNGFIETAEKEYFFKFHTEEGESTSMKNEYYQAQELAKTGLPILQPVYASTKPGGQFLIYEKVEAKTAFDLFQENSEDAMTSSHLQNFGNLLEAEERLLQKQRDVYLKSLKQVPADEVKEAALHQLFYRRLVGQNGATPRLDLFYTGKTVALPADNLPFDRLAQLKWVINGREYQETLQDLVTAAKALLNPSRYDPVAVVLGHGDDHNGNKFYIEGEFVFFDPAFAGWQPALLSFVKATAHNVFLHPDWLYDPEKLQGKLNLHYRIEGERIIVDHNWELADRSPVRLKILDRQTRIIWQPLLSELKARGWLPDDWQNYLQKALFCCPFLVYNLIDPQKYSTAASLLALSKCVELGSRTVNGDIGMTSNFLDNIKNF